MNIPKIKFTTILSATLFVTAAFVWLAPAVASAQGTGFNFQGRLNDGTNPANGSFDLQFRLYDAIVGGNQINAVAPRPNTTLINGVFSVTLDFGATAFNNPNSIFIEIAVRPNGSPNAYTILGPRQQLTVVPFAVRSATATLADNATNAANAQNAVNAQNSVNATNATNATTATNATNATNAQNAVNAANATNATTALTANNALNLGGVTPVSFARLDFANPGNLLATGLLLTNDARQPANANGLVKAMIYVNTDGTIIRCYNGIANSSTGTCGFSISQSFGSYSITFPFQVNNRFVSVTPEAAYIVNVGASFFYNTTNQISVRMFATDSTAGTNGTPHPFTIIVY